MNRTLIFRVAPYSPSTSRFTIHQSEAAILHKFLVDEGLRLEPMAEATGTVLLAFVDESGKRQLEPETEIITFVADATPSILQPLLLRWLEEHAPGSGAAPQEEENAQDGNGNSQEPEGNPAPSA